MWLHCIVTKLKSLSFMVGHYAPAVSRHSAEIEDLQKSELFQIPDNVQYDRSIELQLDGINTIHTKIPSSSNSYYKMTSLSDV